MLRMIANKRRRAALLLVGFLGAWPALAEKSVLRLRLDGPVMEAPDEATGLLAVMQQQKATTLHELVQTISRAAADRTIDGLVLIIEQPEISLPQVEELTRAMRAFRAAGKPVYCYLDDADNLTYALATAADHITLAENSLVAIMGLRAELMFFKGLLDKIGVEADMMHCGAYKSALEPFTRTEPSPEAAENVNWLLSGLYDRWVQLIAEGRKLSVEQVRALVDKAPLTAAQALQAALVDEVGTFSAFKQRIRKEFGPNVKVLKEYEEPSGIKLDLENPFALFQVIGKLFEKTTEPPTPAIGLIYIEGAIDVGKSDAGPFGGNSAGSTTLRAAFEQAREDENIKAVVVRVDSPGGSALASDIIWNAATRCAAEKPLVVSMGRVAGSGGYYVAVPGDVILAEATTITGSIGVVGGKLVWRDLLHNKLGITTTEFTRGQHAGLMSLNRKWTDAERSFMMDYMNGVYEQFKGRVLASRGQRLKKELEDIAGGRVYTGQQAVELGLVDQIGGLSDALELAAKKAGLGKDYKVRVLPKQSEMAAFLELLRALGGGDDKDEFEITLSRRLTQVGNLTSAWPLLRELAPEQVRGLLQALQNLLILQRERVACFMPLIPQVR